MREFTYGALVGIIMGVVITVAGIMFRVAVYGPDAAPQFCQSRVWYDRVEFLCDN